MSLKVILIGTGGFGSCWEEAIITHRLQVVAIVEKDEAMAEQARERYKLPKNRVFKADDLSWAQLKADLVIDSAPPFDRKKRIIAALLSGKNCLSAKPVILDVAECLEIMETEKASGKSVYVAMQKRYFPAFQNMKQLVSSGKIGTIGYVGIDLQVDGTVWEAGLDWRKNLLLPSLYEGAVHHIDLLCWLLDAYPSEIFAYSWNPVWSDFSSDADFCAAISFKPNMVAHYLSRWSTKRGRVSHYFSGFRIEGTESTIEVLDGNLLLNNTYIPYPNDGGKMMDLSKLNQILIGDVLKAIYFDDKTTTLNLTFHSRVLQIVTGIAKSIQIKRTVLLEI